MVSSGVSETSVVVSMHVHISEQYISVLILLSRFVILALLFDYYILLLLFHVANMSRSPHALGCNETV